MRTPFQRMIAVLTAVITACQLWPGLGGAGNPGRLSFLSYPGEVGGLTSSQISELKDSIGTAPTPEANAARDGLSVFVSPFFELAVNGICVPVYAAGVYVAETDGGELHSYAVVNADFGSLKTVKASLKCKGFPVAKAEVLPESLRVNCRAVLNIVSAEFTDYGDYTFLFNGRDQAHVFTLFLRKYTDEDEEIRQLRDEYSPENVIVYDRGLHRVGDIVFDRDNTVVYLRSGAILKAEPNGSGQDAVFSAWGRKNIKILGGGTVDLGSLAWKEKCGVNFSGCDDVTAEGVIFVNSAHWTFITHDCDGVCVRGCAVFGYRTNSDGFNICSTHNALVEDCFSRTGDDAFSVKGTGEAGTVDTRNVTFRRCCAYAGKARCFGITGEIYCDIADVLFTDCAVIVRDAVWDNDIVSSLAVCRENGTGSVRNVVFDNIEIHYDKGRAINCIVNNRLIQNTSFDGIVFRNIKANTTLKSQFKDLGSGNTMDIALQNCVFNGVKIRPENFRCFFGNYGGCKVVVKQ